MHLKYFYLCRSGLCVMFFFFFQAEDGIRDLTVTGVQTCALPISSPRLVLPNGCGCAAPRAHAALPARIMDHLRTVDFIVCETGTVRPGALPGRGANIFDHGETLAAHDRSCPRVFPSPTPLSRRERGTGGEDPPPRASPARLPAD